MNKETPAQWLARELRDIQESERRDAWALTGPARVKQWELFTPNWPRLGEHDSLALRALVALSMGLHPAFADEAWVFQVALPYFRGERDACETPFADDSPERCADAVHRLESFIWRLSAAFAGLNAGTLPECGTGSNGQPWVRCVDFAKFAAAKSWNLPAAFPWSAPVAAGETATAPTLKRPAETPEQRQERRIAMCEEAGLKFDPSSPDRDGYRLPPGVGAIAKTEGISRAAFTEDVRTGLLRRYQARRAGWGPQGY